ncbi:hypothetical protein V1264_010307 [Littorina saxatilis]|uniref:Uncharacterized protein n=2 Tax=Littorina saxatilis TaxID=31220 RepID=A0AAN9AP09_9CAEN
MTTQQATANPLTGADNSSSPCVPQDDGSCVPFDELLIGVLGSLKEGALDDLLNDTGTDLGDVMHGRQTLPDDHHTALSVINMLKASRNRTDVTQQVIKDLDVSNMTHQEAGSAMEAIYDLLVADNSTEEGGDDRVASLLFKMAYVSSVDSDMLTTFAKSTALVLYGEGQKPQKKDKKEMQVVRVLQSMERILTTSNVSSLQQNLDQLVMSVVDVNMTQSSDDVTLNVKVGDAANVMRLSRSLFPSDEGKVSSVVYTDIHHLLPSNRQGSLKGGVVNSHVISLVVHNGIECCGHYFLTSGTGTGIHTDEHDFHDHLDFTVNFTLPRLNAGRPGMDEQRWCVHWKFHSGAWSEDGCWLLEHNLTHTTCTCNHLSTFAVLVTFTKPAQISAENERGMFVLTAIGCSLSIAGLTFTLLTYIYLRILHRERILIHASLALSLLLAQVLFISSDHARDNEVACKIVAALLHFLFMAAFSWMLVEGMALYRTCTRGLLYSSDMRLKYSIIGWGLPLIVVVISLGVEFPNYGRGLQNSCWLSVNKGLIWAFLAPMLVIVSLNVLILCLVIRVFLTLRANSQKTETARARAGLRAMLMLLPLLGTTWLLSLLVPLSSVFGYLFIVCNSLQGLMIFVLHCLSNEEVRRFLAMKRGGSRSRTSESNLSVIGWRRRSPALTFDDVKVRIPQRGHCAQNEGRKTAWV